MDNGIALTIDGRPAVRFERLLPHTIDIVWTALTDPAKVDSWFPSRFTFDAKLGGEIRFSGDPNTDDLIGEVLAYEPPTHFAFTWGDSEVRFELTAHDDSTRFVLTNLLGTENESARNAAGWHVCLAELDKALASGTASGPHAEGAADWQPLYEQYIAAGMPSGAPLPD
jgi:uncharacterized protein YndB with AHSA1/START domain